MASRTLTLYSPPSFLTVLLCSYGFKCHLYVNNYPLISQPILHLCVFLYNQYLPNISTLRLLDYLKLSICQFKSFSYLLLHIYLFILLSFMPSDLIGRMTYFHFKIQKILFHQTSMAVIDKKEENLKILKQTQPTVPVSIQKMTCQKSAELNCQYINSQHKVNLLYKYCCCCAQLLSHV